MSRLDELDLSSGLPRDPSEGPSAGSLENAEDPAAEEPLSRLEVGARQDLSSGSPALVDLPLRPAARAAPPAPALPRALPEVPRRAAPLSARGAAFAADAALVLLLAAASLLVATAGRGQSLRLQGLLWTAVFALYLSFFATVIPLVLFGKTVGMALTGLTARGLDGAAPLTIAEAARRWLGTLATLSGLGAPLLVTRRDREAPSPADRFSGRPLDVEEAPVSPRPPGR